MKLGSLVLALLVGCGGSDGGPDATPVPATVSIDLENNTPAASRLWHYDGNETPDDFAVKLIAVTLQEPHDVEPGGEVRVIHLNPACTTLESCDLAAIDDFLEIQRPSTEVNAELGAVAHQVAPGRYNMMVMHWSADLADGENARYRMDGWVAGASKDIVWGDTATTGVTLPGPVVIPDGANVRVTLRYNLEGMVLNNQSIDGCPPGVDPSCYSEGQDRWFIVGRPEFSAVTTAAD